jgi:hypothetical protein
MGKIGDLFKNKLARAFTEPGMKLNGETLKDFSRYNRNLTEKDEVSEDEKEENTEAWSEKYKKSIDCSHPKGFSQRAHCQGLKKKSKSETKETTSSGSVGAYSGQLFGEFNSESNSETPSLIKRSRSEKVEAKEATTGVGAYSSPAMWAKSTKKKDWGPSRKTQIPGGGFVKVKKKCTKFPYCNQGDINALKITKNESVKEAIKNVSNKLNISEIEIKKILQNEMNKLSKRNK